MRRSHFVVTSLCAGLLGGCSQRVHAAAGDGELVLEVGGDGASLRDALRAAGVAPAAPAAPAPPTGEAHAGVGADPANSAAASVAPNPLPVPPASGEPPWFTVTLAEGQTPIHLARKHLGDGNRFREILAVNGWDEDDARRLRPGQTVKIPRGVASTTQGR